MFKRDFTLRVYSNLLENFIDSGYFITTFQGYLEGLENQKYVILRHDIDKVLKMVAKETDEATINILCTASPYDCWFVGN